MTCEYISLQAIIERFMISGSDRDTNGLLALKNLMKAKQVTVSDNDHYYANSLFLEKVLDGFMLTAASYHFTNGNATRRENKHNV